MICAEGGIRIFAFYRAAKRKKMKSEPLSLLPFWPPFGKTHNKSNLSSFKWIQALKVTLKMQKNEDREEKMGRDVQERKGPWSKNSCQNSVLSLLSHLILRSTISEDWVTSPTTKNQQNESLTFINRLAKREITCASPMIGIGADGDSSLPYKLIFFYFLNALCSLCL